MKSQELAFSNTIRLADRRVSSDRFKPLYSDGMKLVEEAAGYLDGEGRADAKKMSRTAATLYAAESMRLTTQYIGALETGIRGLNTTLRELGEKQIVIQQVKKKSWFSRD